MSRAYDFTVITVVTIICIVVHLMAVELFAPGTPLHDVASAGTTLNGSERANLWYQILAVWVPTAAVMGMFGWGVMREYRRQTATAVRRRAL